DLRGGRDIRSVEINVPESATLRGNGWRNAVEGNGSALNDGNGSSGKASVVALGGSHDREVGRSRAGPGRSGGSRNRCWGGVSRGGRGVGSNGAAGGTASGQIGNGDSSGRRRLRNQPCDTLTLQIVSEKNVECL